MLFGLIKNKGKLPAPYLQVKRHPCPFYGFNGMFGPLRDSEGNQCALITESYSPCRMEMDGKEPDWNLCPIHQNSSEEQLGALEKFAKREKIFPDEFHPPGARSWEGIPLSDWMNYILDKK